MFGVKRNVTVTYFFELANKQQKKADVSVLLIVKWLIRMEKWNLIHCWKILKKSFSVALLGDINLISKEYWDSHLDGLFSFFIRPSSGIWQYVDFLLVSCCSDFFFFPSKVLAFPRNWEKKSVGKKSQKRNKS